MCRGTISNVALVQSDRLAIESVGQGFISCCGIALASSCNRKSADEILVQLAFQAKAHANAASVAVLSCILHEAFAAHSHIARKPEFAERRRKCRHFLLIVLSAGSQVRGVEANVCNVRLQLGHRVRSLGCCAGSRAGFALCILQLTLRLLQLLLCLLQGCIALGHLALQVLDLLLLLRQRRLQRI